MAQSESPLTGSLVEVHPQPTSSIKRYKPTLYPLQNRLSLRTWRMRWYEKHTFVPRLALRAWSGSTGGLGPYHII